MKSSQYATAVPAAAKTLLANIRSAIAASHKASPTLRVIVATVEDVTVFPTTTEAIAQGTLCVQAKWATRQWTNWVNARIAKLPQADSLVSVADINAEIRRMTASPTLTLGTKVIHTRTAGTNPTNLFLPNSTHFGTVAQALLGKVFIRTINQAIGAAITPLSTGEILKAAHL